MCGRPLKLGEFQVPKAKGNEKFIANPPQTINFGTTLHSTFASGPVPFELRKEHAFYMSELLRWNSSFHILTLATDVETKQAALFRRSRFISTQLVVEDVLLRDEVSCDKFLLQYKEIVTLSRRFLALEHNRKYTFSVDLAIIPALYIVTKMCRHKSTRRAAITTLQSTPRKEGIWDSLMIAEVGEWLMHEEESMAEGSFIPEHGRIRITALDVDMRNKTVQLKWERKRSKDDPTPVESKTALEWKHRMPESLAAKTAVMHQYQRIQGMQATL
jgi:hypothetical protein